MTVKENAFKVKLYVHGEQVAESDDVTLWQSVFSAINRSDGKISTLSGDVISDNSQTSGNSINKFVESLGIDESTIRGALDPQEEEPYLHLDMPLQIPMQLFCHGFQYYLSKIVLLP